MKPDEKSVIRGVCALDAKASHACKLPKKTESTWTAATAAAVVLQGGRDCGSTKTRRRGNDRDCGQDISN